MPLTTDPNDPGLKQIRPDGQQESYLVLSEEERAKGFVRPLRHKYKHVGQKPQGPMRALTFEEQERYAKFKYVLYEEYNPPRGSVTGRYWTEDDLKGCGAVTTMGLTLAETYARDPKFYGGTYCVGCGRHFVLGSPDNPAFVWEPDGEPVGSSAEEAAEWNAKRALKEIEKPKEAPPKAMHPAVAHVLKFFACEHLSPKLQEISKPFCELAHAVSQRAPDNQETTVALRKLLESKDCAVRAAL